MVDTAIDAGGFFGTLLIAYVLFGARFLYPSWKRWILGAAGLVLVGTFWVATLERPLHPRNAAAYESDCWDGHTNEC